MSQSKILVRIQSKLPVQTVSALNSLFLALVPLPVMHVTPAEAFALVLHVDLGSDSGSGRLADHSLIFTRHNDTTTAAVHWRYGEQFGIASGVTIKHPDDEENTMLAERYALRRALSLDRKEPPFGQWSAYPFPRPIAKKVYRQFANFQKAVLRLNELAKAAGEEQSTGKTGQTKT